MSGNNSNTISFGWSFCGISLLMLLVHLAFGDETATQPTVVDSVETETVSTVTKETKFKALPPLAKPWVKLGQGKDQVWINQETKQVAVDAEVCLTKGYLEMFACILGTKEHESVIAVHSKAFVIHTGLLAVGAAPGSPAVWRPNYQPAKGQVIAVEVEWHDEKGELKRTKAQQWVRDLKTKKALAHDWVFAGSLFYVVSDTKERFYRAEAGEVICVSNFPVSMMDLPIESSQVNDELGFEAFTENIPKRRTPVRMYLTPQVKEKTTKKEAEPSKALPDSNGL